MKRFLMCALAITAALVLAQSAQAQSALPQGGTQTPGQNKGMSSKTCDVEVNGKKHGTVKLLLNGRTNLSPLPSGQRVSLVTKNGTIVSASAVEKDGKKLQAEVRNSTSAANRIVVIIIRTGDGTVIVIVIRQRDA
jgi:hypothetical protein